MFFSDEMRRPIPKTMLRLDGGYGLRRKSMRYGQRFACPGIDACGNMRGCMKRNQFEAIGTIQMLTHRHMEDQLFRRRESVLSPLDCPVLMWKAGLDHRVIQKVQN